MDDINLGQCTTYDLLKLIRDIVEAIEVEMGKDTSLAATTILNDEIMLIEIDDKRFRIEIRDLTQFQ